MRKFMLWLTERQFRVVSQDAKAHDQPISQVIRDLIRAHYGLSPEVVKPGRRYQSSETDAATDTE